MALRFPHGDGRDFPNRTFRKLAVAIDKRFDEGGFCNLNCLAHVRMHRRHLSVGLFFAWVTTQRIANGLAIRVLLVDANLVAALYFHPRHSCSPENKKGNLLPFGNRIASILSRMREENW